MPAPEDVYVGDSSSTEDDESVRAYTTYARNGEASSRSQNFYNDLFNLDGLRNLNLPQGIDDHHSSSSSRGQDQIDSGTGIWRLNGHVNGNIAERPSDIQSEMTMKRKRVQVEADAGRNSARRDDSGSNGEEDDIIISEDHYRYMLSEHFQKYKKARLLESAKSRASGQPARKRSSAKPKPIALEPERIDANGIEAQARHNAAAVKQYARKSRAKKVEQVETILPAPDAHQGAPTEQLSGPGLVPPMLLNVGTAAPYQLTSSYNHLIPPMALPEFTAADAPDGHLRGDLSSTSIVPMMMTDPRPDHWQLHTGMGGIYETNPMPAIMSMAEEDNQRQFLPQIYDREQESGYLVGSSNEPDLVDAVPPEVEQVEELGLKEVTAGQDGATMRKISSEGGLMKHCEVKVIDQGDGYEVIQRRIVKEDVKRDPNVIAKEDSDKIARHWACLIRKDLPKHHRQFMAFHKRQLQDTKRFAEFCQREVKMRYMRSLKVLRSAGQRTRRLARDMVIFWKKVDKEQAEVRKKEERDAADALKREEELREAKRQQQRLNFLLTQTELYSHFMQNKLGGGASVTADAVPAPAGAADAEEEAALKEEAVRVATQAAEQQRTKTNAFDSESSKLRQAASVQALEQDEVPAEVDDIDLLNPSTMPATSSVQQPKMFQGNLKDYQLKGLQWLVNCYEQGLNGILADEMGLGKTVQAMAFLSHLAEEKNIWGPFLVVAPASVLNNWADEVSRFCPDMKILPYWGGLNERTVLRKNINPKRLYKREAVFHVLITSYQLLVSDEKYFRRVKWQYMILDEAQAIKSAHSLRWKTLLSFNCRNRLLLTGTPIQNSMAELWALLHFIMPTLFDSHEQFSEWFSKGIESHAEHGGTLNEHQLTRLHAVLKPFMLRRVKKDVITEMTNKKEVMVPCTLSKRQQAFYRAIKDKISVADLFDSKGALSDKKVLNLMNIVIQLRKVCNHPELFERNEGNSFLHFATMTNSLLPASFGDIDIVHYSGACNPVAFRMPKLLFRDGLPCLPTENSGSCQGFMEKWIRKRLSIFSSDHVHDSVFPKFASDEEPTGSFTRGGFGFTRLLDLSPFEVEFVAKAPTQEQWLYSVLQADEPWLRDFLAQPDGASYAWPDLNTAIEDEDPRIRAVKRMLFVPSRAEATLLYKKHPTGLNSQPFEALVSTRNERFLSNVSMLRAVRSYIPAVQAPPIDVVCSDRAFAFQRTEELENPSIHRLMVGFGRTSDRNGPGMPRPAHPLIQEVDVQLRVNHPLLALPYRIFGSASPMQSFDFAKMLTDSGKLHTLDGLLKRLRAGNHRILLFAQMTKMLNLLEDYMVYRKYKYLRLDGSSTIMDRRDMVKDFQHRGDIFVFLLSTRAGGLGINLTAADTVIFYESDWNPTMDLQAMDRAHRLGQTKEVTVYRMICTGTVEEKILKRASQKNTVQQLVMTGGQSQGDVFQAEEVVSLLLDDAELEQKLKEQKGSKQPDKADKRRKGWTGGSNVKGVRLDAEGGGASLEEDAGLVSNGLKQGGESESAGEKGPGEVSSQVAGRKRRGESKPPKPPKAPKLAKEPKPPKEPKPAKEPKVTKEPKIRRDRKLPRIARPLKDARLPRARGRPKSKPEAASTGTAVFTSSAPNSADATPSGTPPPPQSVVPTAEGVDQELSEELATNGDTIMTDAVPEEDSAALTSNGEVASKAQAAEGPPDVNLSLESEAVGATVGPSNHEGGKEAGKTVAEDGGGLGKPRSRPPKKSGKKLSSESEVNDNHHTGAKGRSSPPKIGTLKLSLSKQPSVDKVLHPVPAAGDPA